MAGKEDKEKEVGKIFTYFNKISVAAMKAEGKLKVGDKIHIKGTTTDFTQKLESMQIDGKDVESVKKGDDVGFKVKDRVRPNDIVYLVK